MRIRFTLTLSPETVAAYRRGGWANPGEMVEDLKEVLAGRLRAVRADERDDEDDEDEDDDEEDD